MGDRRRQEGFRSDGQGATGGLAPAANAKPAREVDEPARVAWPWPWHGPTPRRRMSHVALDRGDIPPALARAARSLQGPARGQDPTPASRHLRERDLGHGADARRGVPAHHLRRARLSREDGARAIDDAGSTRPGARGWRWRRWRAAGGVETPDRCQGDLV